MTPNNPSSSSSSTTTTSPSTTSSTLPRRPVMDVLLRESGLRSVASAGRDAVLVILARTCRMLTCGASSLVLALFFAELGFDDARIGAFMTLTLAGDVVLGLLLTLVADRAGRRRTMVFGSLLMVLSGVVFATCSGFWTLLAAAVVGVISATGGDFGPFRAIEESMLAGLAPPETRADVLAWYVTLSSLGSSVGTVMSGRIVEALRSRDGWTLLDAYRGVFWWVAGTGLLNMACSAMLSERCELKNAAAAPEDRDGTAEDGEEGQGQGEREPLLGGPRGEPGVDGAIPPAKQAQTSTTADKRRGWFAQISRESLSVMSALWFLLMVDSLADGMANMSLTTYYMDGKFHLPKSTLGDVVSASYFLAAVSCVFAGPLARYIGLVNTMVFTHIPSSAAVLLFPLPRSAALTFALLLVRVGLNNMDQAPRVALIAAVVRPEERTAAMGITSMLRTLALTTGPSITGLLAGSDRFWVAFVVAGALRLAYDVGLFAMFINIKLHKHEPAGDDKPPAGARGDRAQEQVAGQPEP